MPQQPNTSWEPISSWYDQAVGEEGHYYHQKIIIPQVVKLLDLDESKQHSLLDLACGQGILGRKISSNIPYCGIDSSSQLINLAKEYDGNPHHQYLQGDITKPLVLNKKLLFSHATCILALQNIENYSAVFQNVSRFLHPDGKWLMVINHPCFRIPRQSSWKVDADQKIQYRRIDKYMSPLKIPIQTHPGKGKTSPQSWSFHHSLSDYSKSLKESGFLIEDIVEWCSDKESTGKMAKMENRARQEIPLFMMILATKKNQ